MTSARSNVTAAWIAVLLAALIKATAIEGDYRERATQMEYRIIIEKLQGNDDRVSAISDWRRDARFAAEQWEQIGLRLASASSLAAVAITVTGWMWLVLGGLSIFSALNAAYTAALATGVL